MALAANALTTLQDVKLELGISSTDVSNDRYLENLINAASAQIESFLQRNLSKVTAYQETVPGYGNYRITVSRTPVLSVTSVEMIETATPPVYYAFDIDDLIVENANAGLLYLPSGWPWTAPLTRTIKPDPISGQEWPSIRVTYDGGYDLPASATPTLPADIQRAATLASAHGFLMRGRDRSIKSEELMSYKVTYEKTGLGEATLHKLYPASSFPMEVIQMLVPHRKIPGA